MQISKYKLCDGHPRSRVKVSGVDEDSAFCLASSTLQGFLVSLMELRYLYDFAQALKF
ncbi:MAG: hypothetical protein HC781_05715 [Leptolyngbyaceae cyanobacterium CSU_1_4]|nr:hypothetical protein [Leptolyngbyaceae cyanobacterium CSU_1_4]